MSDIEKYEVRLADVSNALRLKENENIVDDELIRLKKNENIVDDELIRLMREKAQAMFDLADAIEATQPQE